MRRRLLTTLVATVVVGVAATVATVVTGARPLLGLDLQGGAYVVLQPSNDVSDDVLDQTIEIIRDRVDALGVAEPDIARQGDAVVVQLPGVRDQQRALEIVGQTAELRFRPVLQVLPPEDAAPTTTTAPGGTTTTTVPADTTSTTAAAGTTGTTSAAGATSAAGTTVATGPVDLLASTAQETTTTTAPDTTTTTTAPATDPSVVPTTRREQDVADQVVVLPQLEDGEVVARYQLGPASLTGEVVDTAQAQFPQGRGAWVVTVDFTSDGATAWDDMAAGMVGQQLAIVLDGQVISAPTIQTASFGGTAEISGSFTEAEAKDLALVLRYGALPVQLEPQTTQTVSATLGRDSLEAGLIAGVVGLALVAAFLVAYYRLLGVVALLSLSLTGLFLWALIAWLGDSQGLALTLAGVTGIIVSIGVAVDSNVVYYERVKEEVRGGRSLRSAIDGGWKGAWGTIVRADSVSMIGAAVLYFLTVGSVRGFAFMLLVSTILDVAASWFFLRPAVILLSRSRWATPRAFGVPLPGGQPAPAVPGGAR